MVNVYEYPKVNVAELAKNESLIESCMSANPKLTPSDVRRNLDLAYGIIKRHAMKLGEIVTIKKEVPKHDGNVCMDCGSINLTPTGSCRACLDCGASQGCS